MSFDDPAKLKMENIHSEGLPSNKPAMAGITASITHGIMITYFLIWGSMGSAYLQYARNSSGFIPKVMVLQLFSET